MPCSKLIEGSSAESSEFFPTFLNDEPATMLPAGLPPASCMKIPSTSTPSNIQFAITMPVGPVILFAVEPSDPSARSTPLCNVLNSHPWKITSLMSKSEVIPLSLFSKTQC